MKKTPRLVALASVTGLGVSLFLFLVSVVFAAPLNYNVDTTVSLSSPSINLTIKSSSTADTVVVNAGSVVVTVSGTETFTLTSATRDLSSAGGGAGATVSLSCSSARVATLSITSTSGSNTYTITPLAGQCDPGGTSSGGSSSPPPPPPPSSPTTSTGTVTATPTAGGTTTIQATDGMVAGVSVPPSILSSPTVFSVAPVLISSPSIAAIVAAVPQSKQIVGSNIYDYSAATSAGATVSTFSGNLTITFTYTNTLAAGFDAASLKVNYFDTTQSIWVELPTTVNTATNTVTATVNHFTRFAIFASVSSSTPPPLSVGDGNLARGSAPDVYILKVSGAKKFKRHVLNANFGTFYPHLAPFWSHVMVTDAATMASYSPSAWIRVAGQTKVWEVNGDGTKHWISCAIDGVNGQDCSAKWNASGRDAAGIYTVNSAEFNSYVIGPTVLMP